MKERQAPKVNDTAREKIFDKMYVNNVSKRLRELNQPTDVDRKRWIWELLQNAKDSIANNSERKTIRARILIDGDTVKFQHDGDPFTPDARYGLLYKYSEDKENAESTGRFGTGFLTTHCLSKIVSIESNMYGDGGEVIGFSVTMYRDGTNENELLEGVARMRESEKYWDPFEWTTYTYHVNTDSGRRAILLGKENFKENIAQTLLFCDEIASIELNDNGEVTTVKRVSNDGLHATFEIVSGSSTTKRMFLHYSLKKIDEDLSKKYKKERSIRLQIACEIDEKKNIISTDKKTSLFCVFPLVGIEDQLQMPFFINCPDFEPDSERQSLLLNGNNWDEEKDIITEVGINQKIMGLIPDMFDSLLVHLSSEKYNATYNLANGLKAINDHPKLDKKWYSDTIVTKLRGLLSEYAIVKMSDGSFQKLSECVFVKEKKEDKEDALFTLVSDVYPNKVVADNKQWAHSLWKEESGTLKLWGLEEFCEDIQAKEKLSGIELSVPTSKENSEPCTSEQIIQDRLSWYNRFLKFVSDENELLMKEYALLPNMNGDFLKKDTDGFKQAEGITDKVLTVLASLGEDVKPLLLHPDITTVALESKFNSISFSSKANNLAKSIIEATVNDKSGENNDNNKLRKLIPLFSITVSLGDKYDTEFIEKRKRIFEITKDLFELTEIEATIDNSFNKSAWEATDIWLTDYFIRTIEQKAKLSALPSGLGAKWLNDSISSLGISLSKMNQVAILPNQNGVFCKSQFLYIDDGIPTILKAPIFDSVGISYKQILLDSDINASSFGKTQKKTVSDFARELNDELSGSNSCDSDNKRTIRSFDLYRKYPETTLKAVAHYLIQILPEEDTDGILQKQENLRSASRFFLDESCKGHEDSVDFAEPLLWAKCNQFICKEIMSKLEEWQTIKETIKCLDSNDEELFANLNILYRHLITSRISTDNRNIIPNQEGTYSTPISLFIEGETIDKDLKDVISHVADDANNYYKILVDSRCTFTLSQKKTKADAYALIDGKIKQLYDSSSNWEDDNFKEACRILIDVWGDSHRDVFDANHFPKVFPIKDSISMNVVWTKSERQQLQHLKNALSTDDLSFLVDHSDEIKNLSVRAQELEDENERLREIIKALREGRSIDFDFDNDSDASKAKQYEAQVEAQRKLMELFPDWHFPEHYGEQDETGKPYCGSTEIVENEMGETLPIVLKSYKTKGAIFKVNTTEWNWVVKKDAKLLVYTYIDDEADIVEIPREDLIMKQPRITITFSTENLKPEQYRDRISDFASTLRHFNELHFKFVNFHVRNSAPRARDIYAIHEGVQTEQEY